MDDCAWMLDGATKKSHVHIELGVQVQVGFKQFVFGKYTIKLQGIDSGSSRVDSLSNLERSYEFLSRSSRFTCGVNLFVFAQRPKLSTSNRFVGSESTPSSRFHKLPRIESIQLIPEPIRFYPDFKINVQNALRIHSPSSESIPKSRNVVLKNEFSEE
ncbi:hypothetical protein PIB30_015483 [Stylosanthes scabra]|uniref:Uncharacterized protein n=1 Tax=Stylosanthes scabra TaxID=79078 RepID=A0ABU6W6I0_9FABA|nr:hypothetical protein [Stylosanthes scabra]